MLKGILYNKNQEKNVPYARLIADVERPCLDTYRVVLCDGCWDMLSHLAKRLLLGKAISDDAERTVSMVALNCGALGRLYG